MVSGKLYKFNKDNFSLPKSIDGTYKNIGYDNGFMNYKNDPVMLIKQIYLKNGNVKMYLFLCLKHNVFIVKPMSLFVETKIKK